MVIIIDSTETETNVTKALSAFDMRGNKSTCEPEDNGVVIVTVAGINTYKNIIHSVYEAFVDCI